MRVERGHMGVERGQGAGRKGADGGRKGATCLDVFVSGWGRLRVVGGDWRGL